jgi:hypothetical protein
MAGRRIPSRDRFWRELLRVRATHRWGNFSWISLNTLLQSANDKIAKFDATIVDSRRMRWIAAQRQRGIDPFAPVRLPDAGSLIALGDPGEMDASQYVLVRDLMSTQADVLLLMSDIVYPAGDINAWRDGVYLPYFGLPPTAWSEAQDRWTGDTPVEVPAWHVFASPGNHDWYDGLTGFMWHTSGAEPLPTLTYSNVGLTFLQRMTRRLWQHPAPPDRDLLEPLRAEVKKRWPASAVPGPMPWQPAPYFALDLGNGPALRIVSVDTGIDGSIDIEQAEWLKAALAGDVPKVVVTGKPLVSGNEIHSMPVNAGRVTERERAAELKSVRALIAGGRRVIATLAGDIHNSQRIVFAGEMGENGTVTITEEVLAEARRLELPPVQIVAGGGGAFLSATHPTPLTEDGGLELEGEAPLPEDPIPQARHTYYPTREQSVGVLAARVGRVAGAVAIVVGAILMATAAALAALAHRAIERGAEQGPSEPASTEVRPSDVCVSGACLDQLYALLAPVAVVALVAGGVLLFRAVTALLDRNRRVPRLPTAIGVVAACVAGLLLWLGWDVPVSDLPVVLGALAVAFVAPLLPVLVPLVESFPAIGRLIPLRAIAVAAPGLLLTIVADVTLTQVLLLAAAAVPVFIGLTRLVALATRRNDEWAIDHRRPVLRGAFAIASLWPVLLIVVPIYFFVPQDPTGGPDSLWQNAKEPAAMIVFAELGILLLALLFLAAKTLWRARASAPWWLAPTIALAAVALGVLGVLVARSLSAELGWAILAGAGGALGGAIAVVGIVLAASAGDVTEAELATALEERDRRARRGRVRSRHLFRMMVVAATPGISEIAEATRPPFYKSFLRISWETGEQKRLVVRFDAYGVEDEPFDGGGGAHVVDSLRLTLDWD